MRSGRISELGSPANYQLRRQLLSLQHGSDSVSTYYTKLKSIWEELSGYKPTFNCSCDGMHQLQQHAASKYVMTFLIGLHDSFSQICGQILLSDPLPSIGNVFSLILQEESQREIIDTQSSNNSESLAFSVNSSQKTPIDKQKFTKKPRPKCTHCDILSHTKETCYKIVGYPPNYFKNRSNSSVNNVDGPSEQNPTNNRTLTTAQCQQLIQYLTTQLTATPSTPSNDDIATNVIGNTLNSILPINSYQWIIDSGATSYICCYKSLYDSYVTMNNSHVLLPNSFKVKVEGIGSIKLTQDIFLHNVLYIPSSRFNLLSLLTLIQQNQFCFIMQPNFFHFAGSQIAEDDWHC